MRPRQGMCCPPSLTIGGLILAEEVLHIPLQRICPLSLAMMCRLFPMVCKMCQNVHIRSQTRHGPKEGKGTSDGEMSIDDDKEDSGKTHMPFDTDLRELSDHASDVEARTGARDQRVGPEGRSGPSKETKRARVDLSISDAQRSLSNESIGKLLAHECDCGKDCTSFITRKDTLR